MNKELEKIGERLRTQDNRCTADPMFCVQIKIRDVGFHPGYTSGVCWYNPEELEVIYDDDPDFKEPEGEGWEKYGYKDRWEDVMAAFTEEGCKEYLALNGHNDRRRAHNGEVRTYVKSFYRCPEMIAIRKALMDGVKV